MTLLTVTFRHLVDLPHERHRAWDTKRRALLNEAYTKGAYGLRIDYSVAPAPPLGADDSTWARELMASAAT